MLINGKEFFPKRFSSGELKLLREILNSYIKDNKVEIISSNNFSMFELLIIIDYYISNNVMVDLILTYLPYQRMDHEGTQEVNTINNVANILNGMNLNSITICEPHCEVEMFKNSKVFSYIYRLKDKVFKLTNFDTNKDLIIFTDKGGLKRYKGLAKNFAYFNKVRDKDTGLIIKHEIIGDVDKNSKVIIVDDIISTGDTLINVVDKLTELGVKEIYVFTGHIEDNPYNQGILEHKNVTKVFSTNSLCEKTNEKLKQFTIKEIFYE